jgi:putative phosphoesterase
MRIAVVSDIHGNLPALKAVVRDFGSRGVDAVINLGDSLSGPLLPLETARFLMAQSWVHLAGNHERQMLTGKPGVWNASDEFAHGELTERELAWMASQKPCQPYGADVLLCHATPRSDTEYFLETVEGGRARAATQNEVEARLGKTDAELILCGHTHVPRAVHTRRGQLVVNPGSVGLPAYAARNPEPHVMENGTPDARYALLEKRDGAWRASLLAVPYDHATMSELARSRRRDDWAHALATGYAHPADGR